MSSQQNDDDSFNTSTMSSTTLSSSPKSSEPSPSFIIRRTCETKSFSLLLKTMFFAVLIIVVAVLVMVFLPLSSHRVYDNSKQDFQGNGSPMSSLINENDSKAIKKCEKTVLKKLSFDLKAKLSAIFKSSFDFDLFLSWVKKADSSNDSSSLNLLFVGDHDKINKAARLIRRFLVSSLGRCSKVQQNPKKNQKKNNKKKDKWSSYFGESSRCISDWQKDIFNHLSTAEGSSAYIGGGYRHIVFILDCSGHEKDDYEYLNKLLEYPGTKGFISDKENPLGSSNRVNERNLFILLVDYPLMKTNHMKKEEIIEMMTETQFERGVLNRIDNIAFSI